MPAFLITFKPLSENKTLGWPIEEVQRLARILKSTGTAEEDWRFSARRKASLGDRVFLLQQGKRGPAIIGYGTVAGRPIQESGHWFMPIRFDGLADAAHEVLADVDEVLDIGNADRLWRTQASGVQIPTDVAYELEKMVVGRSPHPRLDIHRSSPDWTRDELVVALDFYLSHRTHTPSKSSNEIQELSRTLNQLGTKLFPPESSPAGSATGTAST